MKKLRRIIITENVLKSERKHLNAKLLNNNLKKETIKEVKKHIRYIDHILEYLGE